jgi:hypothetical protein
MGKHFTALVILTPLANPDALSTSPNKLPEESPTKGTPDLLAPCMPGARPTIISEHESAPEPGTGLFQ